MNSRAPSTPDEIRLSRALTPPCENEPVPCPSDLRLTGYVPEFAQAEYWDSRRRQQSRETLASDRLSANERFARRCFYAFLCLLAIVAVCSLAGGVLAAASEAAP